MHSLFWLSLIVCPSCVAAIGVMHFSCVTSVTHFLIGEIKMNVKVELLKTHISDFINSNLEDFEIDASQIADTVAINMLYEIQSIISNENYSDFEAIEEIVCVFERNKIDFGFRHDF